VRAYPGAVADPTRGPDSGHRDRDRAAGQPHRSAPVVITNARSATSAEMSGRVRRYTITMAFRMVCFLSMLFVHGWLRWALLAFAVFLPYIAVVLANQADQRSHGSSLEHGAPADAPQLTTGEQVDLLPGEVVEGSVVEDEPEGRVA
jgi:hypothetical protein